MKVLKFKKGVNYILDEDIFDEIEMSEREIENQFLKLIKSLKYFFISD